MLNHTEQVLATQVCAVSSSKTSIAGYPILQAAYVANIGILTVQYSAMPLNQIVYDGVREPRSSGSMCDNRILGVLFRYHREQSAFQSYHRVCYLQGKGS